MKTVFNVCFNLATTCLNRISKSRNSCAGDIIAEQPALLVMELLDIALWLCNVRQMSRA